MSIKNQRALLRQENRKYGKEFVNIPRIEWPKFDEDNECRLRVLRNRDFLVQIYVEESGDIRLTVNRTDQDRFGEWKDGITWVDLQDIKRAVGYGDFLAIEFYPEDKNVVNVANMRHLFVILNHERKLPKHWQKEEKGETISGEQEKQGAS